MGYKRAGFAFSGNGYADSAAVKRWLRADLLIDGLLAPLARDGYLARVDRISRNLAEPAPIASLDDLHARAATWGHEIVSLYGGDRADPDVEIFLGLDTVGPRWVVGVADPPDALREHTARWIVAWSDALAVVDVRIASAQFAPSGRSYPRPIPPRRHDFWPPGALDQYLGRSWHRAEADTADVIDRLERAPLPVGAHRTIDGDVLRIAFDADLGDAPSVAAARAAHERWLTPLVNAPIEPGWNEHGDRAVYPALPAVREPFTLYDEQNCIGYKALVLFPEDGSVDEDVWAQIAALARDGALADGTSVKSVRLVVPRREDAIALYPRARASGFEMVTYPAGHVFWQVHPEGE